MTQQLSIEEGNKLIAEFMGGKCIYDAPEGWIKSVQDLPNGTDRFELKEGKYHKSFDWLIPVEKKIYSTEFKEEMDNLTRKFDHWEIDKLWNACVVFIQFYNTQPKPLTS